MDAEMRARIKAAMKPKKTSRTGNYHSCARKKGCVGLGEGIKGYYACANRTPGSCKKSMVTRRAKAQALKVAKKSEPKKGQMSKTMKGKKDFSTKKGNKDFDRGGKRKKTAQGSKKKREPFDEAFVKKQNKKLSKALEGLRDTKAGKALFDRFMQGK